LRSIPFRSSTKCCGTAGPWRSRNPNLSTNLASLPEAQADGVQVMLTYNAIII
jgi:hypothetical protein